MMHAFHTCVDFHLRKSHKLDPPRIRKLTEKVWFSLINFPFLFPRAQRKFQPHYHYGITIISRNIILLHRRRRMLVYHKWTI